jgi:uncharacterized membrane protein
VFYFITPLAVIALIAIIYTALSKKSGFRTRAAALIALGLMLLSVVVCVFLAFGGTAALAGGNIRHTDLPAEESAAGGNGFWIFLAFLVFMIALFVVVAILSFREQRRIKNADPKSRSKAA